MRHSLMSATFFLALLTGRAAAQVPPPRPEAPALAAPAAPADTVAALHRLFAERRRRRNVVVGITGGLALAAVVGVASDNHGSGDLKAAGVVLFGVLGGAAVTGELLSFRKYSFANEQRAVNGFQAHQLAGEIRRKLRPRHFQQR